MSSSKSIPLLLAIVAAALPLAAGGETEVPESSERCLELIDSKYLADRVRGLKGIEQLPADRRKAVAPRLVELLDSPRWQTVLYAADALRVIGPAAIDQAPAVTRRLRPAIEANDATRFDLLARTVLKLKGVDRDRYRDVIDAMKAAGKDTEWKRYERMSLLLATRKAKDVRALVEIARTNEGGLRHHAIRALREMGTTAAPAADDLLDLAEDVDQDTRVAIQKTLNEIKTTNAPPTLDAVRVRCVEGEAVEIPLAITDSDDLPHVLDVVVKGGPDRGEVSKTGPRTLRYISRPGATGEVTFTLAAADALAEAEPVRAVVDVTPDTSPPEIASAIGAGTGTVRLTFSEPVDPATAESPDAYTISGDARITGARLVDTGGTTVALEAENLVDGTTYTLTARDIVDRAEAANTGTDEVRFTYHRRQPGLAYKMFVSDKKEDLMDPKGLKPVRTGTAKTFDKDVAKRETNYALLFAGKLRVPADGKYTFVAASDDGSFLWIDGKLLVQNPGWHAVQMRFGRVNLKAGIHDIKVYFYQGEGAADLKVYWSGPDLKREEIPAKALFHVPGQTDLTAKIPGGD